MAVRRRTRNPVSRLFGAAVVQRLNAVIEDAVGDDVGLDSHGVVWFLVLGCGGKLGGPRAIAISYIPLGLELIRPHYR